MGRVYLATVLNFFFPGAGYLVLGERRLLAVMWLIGVIGLTYVETSLKGIDMGLHGAMFASVLLMNTAFAIDAWKVGKQKVASTATVAGVA